MTRAAAAAAPRERIVSLDALRGFALIGVFFVNITRMGAPILAETPLRAWPEAAGDWYLWWFSRLFVIGSMRGVFSLLFGVSMLLFLRGGGRTAAFLARSFWLFVFGAVNATFLLWPHDILIVYALASPILLGFRAARLRVLLPAAVVILAFLSVWDATGWPFAGARDHAAVEEAEATAAEEAEERSARLGSYRDTLGFMTALVFATSAPELLWWILDALALMLCGVAFHRLGWLDEKTGRPPCLLLSIGGFGLGLPLRFIEVWTEWSGMENPAVAATGEFARLAMTLGWFGAFMLAWRIFPWRAIFRPLAALGRMALTIFLLQSAIAAWIFSGFGLGLWNRLGWVEMWALVIPIMSALAAFAALWLSRFRMGPLERLWRFLTYAPFKGQARAR